MNHLALFLVLTSAVIHASWNFLAKKAGNSPAFVWLFSALAALIYLPVIIVLVVVGRSQLDGVQAIFILGTAILHIAYFLLLQRGYGAGDLSLVYPLARGTGPLLSTLAAIVLLGERPTLGALVGIFLLISGVMFLVGNPLRLLRTGAQARAAVGYALLTGVFIASYTIWDKYAVSALLISPLLLDAASNMVRTVLLTPMAVGKWSKVKQTWREHRFKALGVAVLSPLAYLMVLSALSFSPVSHVAPMRECSVLIGTIMGTHFLAEEQKWRRLGAAGVILLGVILLALN